MKKFIDLNSEIQSIKNQLIEKYHPVKIILFGSYPQGRFGENSDLDFLVVKDDVRNPIKVEQELHTIINYRLATDFIFLNTFDFERRLKEEDFFIKEIISTGKVLYG